MENKMYIKGNSLDHLNLYMQYYVFIIRQ